MPAFSRQPPRSTPEAVAVTTVWRDDQNQNCFLCDFPGAIMAMADQSPIANPMEPGQPTRFYRLVDAQGSPHPVLDDLFDSLEAAWAEAKRWSHHQDPQATEASIAIGVEVSTGNGTWRTLRHPSG